jgi:hypothetical protein
MDCDPDEKKACRFSEQCYKRCPKPRYIENTPIVPGEVGTGPFGLCHTLPPALTENSSAIVYGHGLFTIGMKNFCEAFSAMLAVENRCTEIYFDTIQRLRHPF